MYLNAQENTNSIDLKKKKSWDCKCETMFSVSGTLSCFGREGKLDFLLAYGSVALIWCSWDLNIEYFLTVFHYTVSLVLLDLADPDSGIGTTYLISWCVSVNFPSVQSRTWVVWDGVDYCNVSL